MKYDRNHLLIIEKSAIFIVSIINISKPIQWTYANIPFSYFSRRSVSGHFGGRYHKKIVILQACPEIIRGQEGSFCFKSMRSYPIPQQSKGITPEQARETIQDCRRLSVCLSLFGVPNNVHVNNGMRKPVMAIVDRVGGVLSG